MRSCLEENVHSDLMTRGVRKDIMLDDRTTHHAYARNIQPAKELPTVCDLRQRYIRSFIAVIYFATVALRLSKRHFITIHS